MTTDKNECGLFACQDCGTVKMVTDREYIRERKEQYKKENKNSLTQLSIQ